MSRETADITPHLESVPLPNDVVLEYVEQGSPSGLPVIFLHGATDSWRSFESVFSHLPPSMHAFAISQRGHGNSSRPDEGYRFVDFSEDVREFMDALDIPAAIVVGHSMGSYVAQRFAIDHPGRTLGIVVIGSFARMRGNPVIEELWASNVSKLDDPVDRAFALEFQKSTLARPIDPAMLEMFVQESLKVPARVWRATFSEFLEADFSAELGAIRTPTLIVWGDRDAIFVRSDQTALREAIAGARLLTYPGGGHAVHWEDPDQIAADLVAFADDISSAA